MNVVHLCDCMEFMRGIPDKYYELAIVDPPYGIGVNKMTLGNGKTKIFRGNADWDIKSPDKEYFDELIRISKNQIIWGANHFTEVFHVNSPCWIFWDKGTGENDFSDGEFAYTSFRSHARKVYISWVGANAKDKECGRIHPTQKPVALYKWLLKNYAKPNDKIFDSHVGSGSIRIACHDMGFDFTGCEIDKDYWEAQEERYNQHAQQQDLFSVEDIQKGIYQGRLF